MLDNKRYLNRDVDSIRKELYDIIRRRTTAWTDFNSGGFESHIIDLLAGVSDMLAYYIDNSIRESFIGSAKQEKNLLADMQTFNYNIDTVGTAKGVISVRRVETSQDKKDNDIIIIPRWTNFTDSRNSEVNYVSLESKSLQVKDNEVLIPVIEGKRFVKKVSIGRIRQNYKIFVIGSDLKVPLDYIYITDESWVRVDDAFMEIEGGKKYSVHKDARNRIYILFTYDWRDYLVEEDTDYLEVSYVVTSGSSGVVEVGGINAFANSETELNKYKSSLLISNYHNTYGAFDSVDLNLHRANAMANIRSMDRLIMREDIEAAVRKEPWVINCTVYDWRKDYTVVPEPHRAVVWVVTSDADRISDDQLITLQNKLVAKTVFMTTVEVKNADFVNVPVTVDIAVEGTDTYREEVRQNVEANIKEAYKLSNCDFGKAIIAKDIEYIASRTSSGVKSATITSFDDHVSIGKTEYPIIDKVIVNLVGDNYGNI